MSWTKEKWQWNKSLELESFESVTEMFRSVDLFTESQSVNWNDRVCNTSECCVSACQLILFVTLVALLAHLSVLIRSTAQHSTKLPQRPPTHGADNLRQLVVDGPSQCMRAYALNKTEGVLAGGSNEQIFSVQFVNWDDLFLLANHLWCLRISGITAKVTVGEWLMCKIQSNDVTKFTKKIIWFLSNSHDLTCAFFHPPEQSFKKHPPPNLRSWDRFACNSIALNINMCVSCLFLCKMTTALKRRRLTTLRSVDFK